MAKHLVSLSDNGLTSQSLAKLALYHTECRFNIRTAVVMLHKRFLIELIEVKHAFPMPDGMTTHSNGARVSVAFVGQRGGDEKGILNYYAPALKMRPLRVPQSTCKLTTDVCQVKE